MFLFKGPYKVLLGIKSIAERNRGQILFSLHHLPGYLGNPALADIVGGGQPHCASENAEKVIGGIAAHPGAFRQTYLALQIFLYIFYGFLYLFPVIHPVPHIRPFSVMNRAIISRSHHE